MNRMGRLGLLLVWLLPLIGQERSRSVVEAGPSAEARSSSSIERADELISYRFRLTQSEHDLVATNGSDQTAAISLRQQSPGTESQSGRDEQQLVQPGEEITITAMKAKWNEPGLVYVEAPRRLHLGLRRSVSQELIPLQIDANSRVYDILSAERQGELMPGDLSLRVVLLGSPMPARAATQANITTVISDLSKTSSRRLIMVYGEK